MSIDSLLAGMALWIEFGGAVIVVWSIARALLILVRSRAAEDSITRARLAVADGVLWALSFKLAAALLKTIEIRTWNEILAFAAILALRTLVKQVLVWETRHLESRVGRPASLDPRGPRRRT